MIKRKYKPLLYLCAFVFGIFADRLTKIWAFKNLIYQNVIVSKCLNLSLIVNRGVSWGVFSSQSPVIFYILAFFILAVVILFAIHSYFMYKTKRCCVFCEVLILTGACSNLIDRFYYQGVIDFIDFYIHSWHWPTFNVADIFVVIGVCGILFRYILRICFRKNVYCRKI